VNVKPLAGIVLLLLSGCTDFPAGGVTSDERVYGPVGSLMVQVEADTFKAEDVRGIRQPPFNAGVIRTELHSRRETAFVEIGYTLYELNQTIGFSNIVLRISAVDSSARFYTIAPGNQSFRMETKLEGNIVKSQFGGWLDGTGSVALGSHILVTRGTMHIPVD